MKNLFSMTNDESRIAAGARASARFTEDGTDDVRAALEVRSLKRSRVRDRAPLNSQLSTLNSLAAFTLVEVMVVMTLLTFIVLALMGVFGSTQTAFRASITQTDVLESGRAAMDLMTGDLRGMRSSLGFSNGAVNFYAKTNQFQFASQSAPLIQPLVASGNSRVNVLEVFFVLSLENQTWTGTGYVVDTTSLTSVNPLYRFTMSTNAASDPWRLFYSFTNDVARKNFTAGIAGPNNNIASAGMSHMMDGVVTLRVRAYDRNGVWMTNGYFNLNRSTVKNVRFFPSALGEVGFYMYSNALPAAVEIEMATLEDRTLQRASIWPNGSIAQSNYLAQQAGRVHVFRQRVAIPNVDPAAYQ